MWERAEFADLSHATTLRNLGIANWNILRDGEKAKGYYARALECAPKDSRLIAETVQLWEKMGVSSDQQLSFLEERMKLVLERDDATVELTRLYNETGAPQKALDILNDRSFHPWEGGEGKVLRQYTTARLLLGQEALEEDRHQDAVQHFELAMDTPDTLGEKYHLLQAKADVSYWQGRGYRAIGSEEKALACFESAAKESGDFQNMAVTEFSDLTIYKARAMFELGQKGEAKSLLESMQKHCEDQKNKKAEIDYFATSLPNLLVFEEDIDEVHVKEQEKLIDLAKEALTLL
jgi:tetratricopeptide (TPR) repeat protein